MDCEKCINREYKDKLICCAVAELKAAWVQLLRELPVIRRFIHNDYVCGNFLEDKEWTA